MKPFLTVHFNLAGDEVICKGTCPVTKKPWQLTVPREGYSKWANGMLIQQALPELTAEQREFLISGTSPEGWAILFGGE